MLVNTEKNSVIMWEDWIFPPFVCASKKWKERYKTVPLEINNGTSLMSKGLSRGRLGVH